MTDIDGPRLLEDLHRLRQFGAHGHGVVRPTFSEQDIASRHWIAEQMEAAGLSATLDAAGNVFGRSPNAGPTLILGSHSDTQPEGGWLDGAMGVMYGLEVARALLADPATAHLSVDVASWSDEEGTYRSCLGATSFVDGLSDADLDTSNGDGESVRSALARAGLADAPAVRFEPDRHVGHLEAHIEQGPYLEERDQLIGVVTSIVGIRSIDVVFVGEQNHAGTTPMVRRKDAARAMFEFGVEINRRLAETASPTSVWTIGHVSVEPGAQSIVPGRASITVQFRDADDAVLDAMQAEVEAVVVAMDAAGLVAVSSTAIDKIVPTHMDEHLRSALRTAAERRAPGRWAEMPSAAGHDAMVLSHHLPCAMLFIPSIDGVSHDFAEDSHPDDIVLGCQALADAVIDLLATPSSS